MEAMRAYSADNSALLKDKELITDLTHDKQLLLSQKHMTVMRVR